MYGFVYITENLINGKKYVGMCKNSDDRRKYLGSGKLLRAALKKYGRKNFKRTILEYCKTFDETCKAEHKWIKELGAVNNPTYYNLFEGGYTLSSDSMKKYWDQYTEQERRKMRNWSRRDMRGENNPMHGKKHSDETKRKIGSKSVNRNWGRKTPVDGGLNPKAIKVDLVFEDRTETFDCIKDAANKYDIKYPTLKSAFKKGSLVKKLGAKIVRHDPT